LHNEKPIHINVGSPEEIKVKGQQQYWPAALDTPTAVLQLSIIAIVKV